jgi:signal transduction histidine kinase
MDSSALAGHLMATQETERRLMACALHDHVGQSLTALRITLEIVRGRLATRDDPVIRSRNDDSLELVELVFSAVQDLMHELRPPMLDEDGLVASLQWYARKVARRTGIVMEVIGQDGRRARSDVELALFRIAQEALANVARHAHATVVSMDVAARRGGIILSIEDDGVGFDGERTGSGLVTMRSRAEGVGGTFSIESEPGKGTRVTVVVPEALGIR